MNDFGVSDFINKYPSMSYGPVKTHGFSLVGTFSFIGHYFDLPSIEDSYELEIIVPNDFPQTLPLVTETEGKIPKNGEFHTNPDGTLCVASPLRASISLASSPTINAYVEDFLVPYLYAASHKLRFGGKFVFGELEHGRAGIIEDYLDLLKVDDETKILPTLKLLSMKKRVANKHQCSCGCARRLGKCEFRFKINNLREFVPRSYYKHHLDSLTPYFY